MLHDSQRGFLASTASRVQLAPGHATRISAQGLHVSVQLSLTTSCWYCVGLAPLQATHLVLDQGLSSIHLVYGSDSANLAAVQAAPS